VFVDNTPQDIVRGVSDLLQNRDHLVRQLYEFDAVRREEWTELIAGIEVELVRRGQLKAPAPTS